LLIWDIIKSTPFILYWFCFCLWWRIVYYLSYVNTMTIYYNKTTHLTFIYITKVRQARGNKKRLWFYGVHVVLSVHDVWLSYWIVLRNKHIQICNHADCRACFILYVNTKTCGNIYFLIINPIIHSNWILQSFVIDSEGQIINLCNNC
jgi:hypothetical protein